MAKECKDEGVATGVDLAGETLILTGPDTGFLKRGSEVIDKLLNSLEKRFDDSAGIIQAASIVILCLWPTESSDDPGICCSFIKILGFCLSYKFKSNGIWLILHNVFMKS